MYLLDIFTKEINVIRIFPRYNQLSTQNQITMKALITFITVILLNTILHAQNDTIPKEQNEIVEIYDVVAVYKEITDGRGRTRNYVSELKGEILNYDTSTGVLTFKDKEGRMYSFKSDEYKYFQYDKEFTRKVKNFVLRPRKESEFEISTGFRASFINFNDNFSADDYYLSSGGGSTDLPLSIFLGVGKYFGREHYLGINGEIALTSYGRGYLSTGLRYSFQYDANKGNVAFYLPVELNYFRSRYDQNLQVNDTLVEIQSGGTVWQYPSNKNVEYSLSAVSVSLGQGFGFIINNKHSLAIELSLIKYFPFRANFSNLEQQVPNVRFSGNGFRLSFIYNI